MCHSLVERCKDSSFFLHCLTSWLASFRQPKQPGDKLSTPSETHVAPLSFINMYTWFRFHLDTSGGFNTSHFSCLFPSRNFCFYPRSIWKKRRRKNTAELPKHTSALLVLQSTTDWSNSGGALGRARPHSLTPWVLVRLTGKQFYSLPLSLLYSFPLSLLSPYPVHFHPKGMHFGYRNPNSSSPSFSSTFSFE